MKIENVQSLKDFSEFFELEVLDEEFCLKDFSPLKNLWWVESLKNISFGSSPRMRDAKLKSIVDKKSNYDPAITNKMKKLENEWIYIFGFSYMVKLQEAEIQKLFLEFYSLATSTIFAGTFRAESKWELGLRHLRDLMDSIVERLLEIPSSNLPRKIKNPNYLEDSILEIYPEITLDADPGYGSSLKILLKLKALKDGISYLDSETLYNIYFQ